MSRSIKGVIGTGLIGIVFGIVAGFMYGVTTDNWPGALGMFFGMIGMVYFGTFILWLVFAIDDWING